MRFINKDLLFIVNPRSGKQGGMKLLDEIAQSAPGAGIYISKSKALFEKEFPELLHKYSVFVVAGGDGSINEAIQFLHGKENKYLAVVPCGSGNGFAREMGFKKNIPQLISDCKKGTSLAVDLIQIGPYMSLNVAGTGIDAEVAHRFSGNQRGLMNYIKISAKCFFRYKPQRAEIKLDREQINDRFFMISICNTRQFGNNAVIDPLANPFDGKIDLVLVKPFPVYKVFGMIYRLFTGKLKPGKYIRFISGSGQISLRSESNKFHIDGEAISLDGCVKVSVLPSALRIIRSSALQFPGDVPDDIGSSV